MILKGLQKTTLIDYPGHIACTVFTYPCNFRCPFCHNPELVVSECEGPSLAESEFFKFLKSRQGKLEGVCITGGEPTLHKDLPAFIKHIKKLGFKVKLDTNGSNPEMLKDLIEKKLLDYVAMDVKNAYNYYPETVAAEINVDKVAESIKLILQNKIDYELRTTVVPGLHNKERMEALGEWIRGAQKYSIQNFQKGKTLDSNYKEKESFSEKEIREFEEIMKKYVKKIELR